MKLQSQREEMKALEDAGQSQNTNQLYQDLRFIVHDYEEEEEQRDYSRVSKKTKPELTHSNYACIGSSSCLK